VALLLNRSDVQKLLPMSKAIDVVEAAFGELAAGTAEMPDRTVMTDAAVGGWIAYMPAYLKTGGALGVKAVTVYKENPSKFGLPTTIGTILVQDNKTGVVVAAMDGGLLTGVRTGASGGVATRHLARKNSKVAGVLGTGVMARSQVLALAESADLDTILVYSRSDDAAKQAFAEEFSSTTGVSVRVADSAEGLVRESDIVTIITSATEPVVDGSWWKPGTHINAIGSHAVGVRELDSATIVKSKVVCDQVQACLNEAGDIQIPIEEGVYSADKIHGSIGEVINGTLPGRENDEEITLFKSVGLAVQDISCASLVYDQAMAQGVGLEFDFGG
jgi:alanine dehydrogenase